MKLTFTVSPPLAMLFPNHISVQQPYHGKAFLRTKGRFSFLNTVTRNADTNHHSGLIDKFAWSRAGFTIGTFVSERLQERKSEMDKKDINWLNLLFKRFLIFKKAFFERIFCPPIEKVIDFYFWFHFYFFF